jgi:CRISPR-associated protein Cmr4
MKQQILYIFTRTPLHVGAGSSVGAIDQPVQRERHTKFPIIPASSMKGSFADGWNDVLVPNASGGKNRGESEAAWLFGSDDSNKPFAGALQFSEAKLLAFPVRSAKGSFAWITCPLILLRWLRDTRNNSEILNKLKSLPEVKDTEAIFNEGILNLKNNIVLEEYTFSQKDPSQITLLNDLCKEIQNILPDEPVWNNIKERLVVLSNGMMSFFAQNACEIAQHVRINDETGTAEGGALFNQENVPSETLFYSSLNCYDGRGDTFKNKKSEDAYKALFEKIKLQGNAIQFGGDASTGLGFCTIILAEKLTNKF